MIHIEGLSKRYGDRILFEDVSWHVKKRDRIGLSGPNGSGKTTLLRMLAGTQDPDEGSIRMASDTTIGYLPQDGIVHAGRTVYDEVVTAFEQLLALKAEQHEIEDQLERSGQDGGEHERLLERYVDVTDRFKALGGWEIEASVADVLKGLGFRPEDQARRTEEFSGGWQMRIALAKLLLARPNLLLMDEPTNHLDLPARNWLEEYLGDYPGSVVLVSHDRYFLDATVKRITEVGLKTLTDYHGNYSKYVVEHAARMERLREAWRRQTEEIERVQLFISRFRYQATKAKQVQSRIKLLDKVERIELPPERQRIRFKFPDAPRTGRVVLELAAARKAYDANVVLRKVDLLVERGDRVAIVGPNGSGKSTLMRLLAGVERPDEGTRATGHNAVLAYFAQDQAAVLNAARTVHEEMSSASSVTMAPMIRTILGGFLFSGDDVNKRVGVLSGGERNRLALAKLLLSPSNVLLLDEPTNHLDLASKEILLEALADYGGTLVFVSHDRYFVDKLATRVLEVGAGEVVDYPGGYEDFLDYKKRREAGEATPATAAPPPAPTPVRAEPKRPATPIASPIDGHAPRKQAKEKATPRPPQNREPAYDAMRPRLRQPGAPLDRQARERELRRFKARIAELEQRIAEKERAVKLIEAQMAGPGFYDDRARAATVVDEREKLMWEVGDLMSQWEAVQAEAEQRQRA